MPIILEGAANSFRVGTTNRNGRLRFVHQ
jgi:hypothetical protein